MTGKAQQFVALLLSLLATGAFAAEPCAHRGDNKAAPENTIPAFESAARKGAKQIELDVHLSKDGVPVIMHDNTLQRTTNGEGNISDRTWDELHNLDAGSWFGEAFKGTRIPTLEQALAVIPEGILCNVHLKDAPGVAKTAAEVLEKLGRLENSFLACTLEQAQEARIVNPGIKICNMSRQGGNRGAYIDQTIAAGCQFIQLHKAQGMDGLKEDVDRLHAAGVIVNFFGANDADTMQPLADAGIDYILTDDLDLGLKTLRK
ncbi:MAG: glycerophosphoryl diester phosphodiesterase [Candidatus Hydrogenedentota bacterium]